MPSALARYVARGPYRVGVRTTQVDVVPGRSLPVDLWYPAVASSGAEATDHPFRAQHEACPEAEPASGRWPLVLFSHGNSGTRRQSTFLTTHLASWGIAVVAPDHRGNTFAEMAALVGEDERKAAHFDARRNRPTDAIASLDAALGGAFGTVDLDERRVGALGHSFGAWTVSKLPALDRRVRALCMLAPASERFVGRKAYTEGELPFSRKIPTLVVAGLDDVLVDAVSSVRPFFERLGEPRQLLGIDGADHFHFCDNISLLHHLHERNVRPGLPRPPAAYAELLQEPRMHRLLRALVSGFFQPLLAGAEMPRVASAPLDPGEVGALDPSLRPL